MTQLVRGSQVRSPVSRPVPPGMQAIVLAGGLGTRLLPMTEGLPKPMIEVQGKPFLQHQLELLQQSGVQQVLLLVAYLGQKVEEYFGNGAGLGLQIAYCYEPTPLGTGGALKNAQDQVGEEFLLLNGDTFLAIDYGALVAEFQSTRATAVIVAYDNRQPLGSRNLALAPDGRVLAYQKRSTAGMTHTDAGVIVLRREVLDEIPSGRACSLEEEIYPRLIAAGRMRAWVTSQPFFDIGTPAGLQRLNEAMA